MPVALHGLHHRPRRALPERRARDHRRQFPAQRHLLLDQQRDAVGRSARGDVARLGVVGQPRRARRIRRGSP